MSRFKLVLLSALAVLGVFAVASASASAAPHWLVCLESTTGTLNSLCETGSSGKFELKEITTVLEVEGTSTESKLTSEIGSTKVVIKCPKDKVAGTIEAPGKSEATITYEECSLEGASGCTVNSPGQPAKTIVAEVLDRLVENSEKTKILDEFFEKEKVPFTKIEITGCALKNTLEVKGSQKCELPGGEEVKTLHELECLTTGSSLKLGTKEATYAGTASIKLKDKDAWRVSK